MHTEHQLSWLVKRYIRFSLLSVFQPALHCHVFPQEFILVIPLLLICPLSVFIQSCVK